eukprot:7303359-Lingulodinium_polyedra.AAC.1
MGLFSSAAIYKVWVMVGAGAIDLRVARRTGLQDRVQEGGRARPGLFAQGGIGIAPREVGRRGS